MASSSGAGSAGASTATPPGGSNVVINNINNPTSTPTNYWMISSSQPVTGGLQVVSQNYSVVSLCPAGTLMTGGGFTVGQGSNIVVDLSQFTHNGWQVNGAGSGEMSAVAVCLSTPFPSLSTQWHYADASTVFGGQTTQVTATCPAGTLLSGGGFESPGYAMDQPIQMISSNPDGNNGWQVSLWGGVTFTFTAYAVCLTGAPAGTTSQIIQSNPSSIPSLGGDGTAVAQCPAGTALTGGGFSWSNPAEANYIPSDSFPRDGMSWQSDGWGSSDLTTNEEVSQVSSYAVCLNFPIPVKVVKPLTLLTPTPGLVFIPHLNAYCRSGPDPIFSEVSLAMNGQSYKIDGRNQDDSWYLLGITSEVDCWVPSDTGQASGDTQGVRVMLPIATPTFTMIPVGVNCDQYTTFRSCDDISACKWVGTNCQQR
jgi:hypothetical protein